VELFSSPNLSRLKLLQAHDLMARHVHEGTVPGLVCVVSRTGEVHVDSIGVSAWEGGFEVGPDTLFRISSMTKPITAVATLILLEECVLRLDGPIDRLLPELADRKVVRHIDSPVGCGGLG
jgi:CubicO group peptidase (beta-lactamase class C family)